MDPPLTQERKKAIDTTIKRLQDFYNTRNVLDIIKAKGIDTVLFDFKEHSQGVMGAIIPGENGEREKIVLNKAKEQYRLFVLAHEFGHYILGHSLYHHSNNIKVDLDSSYYKYQDKEDMEADYFARSILVPNDLFFKYRRDGLSIQAIIEKIERLGIPRDVAQERISDIEAEYVKNGYG